MGELFIKWEKKKNIWNFSLFFHRWLLMTQRRLPNWVRKFEKKNSRSNEERINNESDGLCWKQQREKQKKKREITWSLRTKRIILLYISNIFKCSQLQNTFIFLFCFCFLSLVFSAHFFFLLQSYAICFFFNFIFLLLRIVGFRSHSVLARLTLKTIFFFYGWIVFVSA